MSRPELLILIPCHGLEDFPTDLGESEAAGLLNAFAIAFHPALIAATREIPAWRRADDPPAELGSKIFIVPSCSESWLPHGWKETVMAAGGGVVDSTDDREALANGLLETLTSLTASEETATEVPLSRTGVDPELVADFFAFGSAYLQVDLLTRRMHYYSNLESGPLRVEILGAAEAAVGGDVEQARRRLSRAFEILLDARERFFPVDAYLIDLCLLIPRLAEKLSAALSPVEPTTILATAIEWEQIAAENPELVERLKTEWGSKRVGLIGGEYREGASTLLPVESVLWDLERGLATFQRLFERKPEVWARRRYGFSSLVPQILERSKLLFAVHAALDDGFYPDDEHSKFRWEGCDGVGIDAFSRIPLAADSATSFLRLSQRMAESMEEDQAAAVMFARWPEVSSPWFDEFRRIHRYAPVFGKFVTLETFFEETDPAARTHQHPSKEYFAPYLIQAVARGLSDPIARFGEAIRRRHRFDSLACLHTLSGLLRGTFDSESLTRAEEMSEAASADAEAEVQLAADRELSVKVDEAGRTFAGLLLNGAPSRPGVMIFNPLAFPRRTSIELPEGIDAPSVEGPVKHVQFDGTRRSVTLDLPSAGYVWLPKNVDRGAKVEQGGPPTVEEGVLRNEFFEVHLSDETGGIAYIKGFGRQPKRLSQQLAFRFPRKRRIEGTDWSDEASYYSEMKAGSINYPCTGPALAEAVTTGDIIDQTNGERLAGFKQTIRVWRGKPTVEIEVELDPQKLPEGDPWSNYYACRFAWNDETAVLTRSVQETAQPVPKGRFDAPHYIEIAEDELRTTIVPIGLPFHRRIGDRMLDTLMIVAGETRRTFKFLIECDEAYPLRPALDAYCPPLVVETDQGPPTAGAAGWLLRVDAKNVQVTSLHPLPATEGEPGGMRVRLMETEGRKKTTRVTCFRTPTAARMVNLAGESLGTLKIDGDAVQVELHKYEIVTVEMRF